jgi:poly(A) polymerase
MIRRRMTNREAAVKVVKQLRKEGFQALFAGGCVRDMLLARRAKDYDVATDANPDEVIKLFRRTLKVGAKFGVVMVLMGAEQVEVATFRTESGYIDGRHPEIVKFAGAKDDAGRRDFTINGMFYDPVEKQVIDYVGGRGDLKSKIIRTIGAPQQRFGEDYLRMLRAVRFSTELEFGIERKTWRAVCDCAKKISQISGERIAIELEGILTSPNRKDGAKMLLESGLAQSLFEEFDRHQANLGIEVLGRLHEDVDFPLVLSAFFAGFSTTDAMKKCRLLKLSRAQQKHLRFLLKERGRLTDTDISLADLKLLASEPYYEDLYELQQAIQKANSESLKQLHAFKRRVNSLKGRELRPRPLLNGHQLIALGARPGPMVGTLSREMYIAQLSEELQTVNQAKRWVKRWLQKHIDLE